MEWAIIRRCKQQSGPVPRYYKRSYWCTVLIRSSILPTAMRLGANQIERGQRVLNGIIPESPRIIHTHINLFNNGIFYLISIKINNMFIRCWYLKVRKLGFWKCADKIFCTSIKSYQDNFSTTFFTTFYSIFCVIFLRMWFHQTDYSVPRW